MFPTNKKIAPEFLDKVVFAWDRDEKRCDKHPRGRQKDRLLEPALKARPRKFNQKEKRRASWTGEIHQLVTAKPTMYRTFGVSQ